MQSGYPHGQGGICPTFQHQSNIYAPQKNNESPASAYSADGMQTNMVANRYPGALGVAYSPDQMRQGLAQTRQTFHRLGSPHNPKPLCFSVGTSSTALKGKGTGLDEHSFRPISKHERVHPLLCALLKEKAPPFDKIQGLINTQSSLSAKTNSNLEHNGSFFQDERHNKSLQANCLLASINYGQTRKQNLEHLEGVNVTYPQLQVFSPHLSGPSSNTPPTDEQILDFIEKRLARYTSASKQKRCSIIRDAIIQSDCNIPKSNCVFHLPTTSESNEENVKSQGLTFSMTEKYTARGGHPFKEDSLKSSNENIAFTFKSKVAADCTAVASDKQSTGTLTPALKHSQHAPKNISIKNVSIDYDVPVKKHLDVTLLANADGNLVYSDDCGDKTYVGSITEKMPSKFVEQYTENDIATLHYLISAPKELSASLEDVEIIAKVDNFPEVMLQQYWNGDIGNIHLFTSTEYPQIMRNVAATCTKKDDASPVVLTPMSGMTFHMATEKNGCSRFRNCRSTQDEYRSPLNISKNLDDLDKVSSVSWALKTTIEPERGELDRKAVETVRMDSVKDVTDVPVTFETKSVSMASENSLQLKSPTTKDANAKKGKSNEEPHFQITCKEVMTHSKINSSIQIQSILSIPANQSCEDMQKNAHCVYLQRELGVTFSENKVKESPPHQKLHSVDFLKHPQYEDISDDEGRSQQITKQPCVKDLHFEAISEDEESQIKNIALGTRSLTQVPKNNNDQSTFEYKHYVAQISSQAKMEGDLDEKRIPKKQVSSNTEMVHVAQQSSSIACTGFAEHDLSSQKHMGWQARQPVSYHPSYVIKESETDDQMEDDDWIVIPVSMIDIQFEPDEEHVGIELVVLHPGKAKFTEGCDDTSPKQCRLHQPSPDLVPAPSPSKIEVFDTFDSFVKSKGELLGFFKSTAPNELDLDAESHNAQNRRESFSEPEDSCETEDSCDYSSGSEHNRLTVDKRVWKKMSVAAPLDTDDSLSEEETEHKDANAQMAQARRSRLFKHKEILAAQSRKDITEKSNIIILDSDTDDESDQICKKRAKRKQSVCSDLEEGRDSLRDGSGQLNETEPRFQQVKHDINRPNVSMQQIIINLDSDTDSSGSEDGGNTRKRVQVTEARENIQREINRPTTFKRTAFQDSDKVVEKDHIGKKVPTLERIFSSGSDESSNTTFAEQKEPATETVTRPYGTTSERPQKMTRSSKDSSDKLPQSMGKNANCADPVIVRLFVEEASQCGSYLKLSKESKSRAEKQSKDDTIALKTTTTAKSAAGNDGDLATHYNLPSNVKKPKLTSRQTSLSEQEGPSTYISYPAPTTPAQFSDVRQRSASQGSSCSVLPSLPKCDTSTSVSTQQRSSSKLKRSHSYSNTSTLEHPDVLTKDFSSATTQSFARERVRTDWHTSYVPTRLDRKLGLRTEEPLRTASCDSSLKVRPWPSHKSRTPRQRHSSHKPATPLMKRTKLEAIQRTKDINRTTSSWQSNAVGKNYKWAEEQRPTKVASSWEWNRR